MQFLSFFILLRQKDEWNLTTVMAGLESYF